MSAGESKWIIFRDVTPPRRRTQVIEVKARIGDVPLGTIAWHSPWRRYTFQPAPSSVFDAECLRAVVGRIEALMAERDRMGHDDVRPGWSGSPATQRKAIK